MIGETYPFLSEDHVAGTDEFFYVFLSQGDHVIPKLVSYTPIEKGGSTYYNWGFGDLVIDPETGGFKTDDKIESNNGDVKSVFYTVISTLSDFFEQRPEATVYIEGTSRQRFEVYKGLIYRHWKQIEPFYEVKGLVMGKIEPFRMGIDFDYLLISRKKL
jgi:hypothetical protein